MSRGAGRTKPDSGGVPPREPGVESGVSSQPSTPPRQRRHPAVRILLWVLVVAVSAHTLLIATWVGPSNQVRQAIGNDALRSYVVPIFEQNWQLFAPDIRSREHSLEIRVSVVDASGDHQITEWLDLVDLENQMIRGNPFPTRMYLASRRVANRINAAGAALNAEQLSQVEANYLTRPVAELRPALLGAGGESAASATTLEAYLTFDEAATGLASVFAANVWSGEIEHIQYRIASRAIPAFEDRNERRIEDVEPTYRTFGWRPAHDVPDDVVAWFSNYVTIDGDQW